MPESTSSQLVLYRISAVVLEAKTRYRHLSGYYHSLLNDKTYHRQNSPSKVALNFRIISKVMDSRMTTEAIDNHWLQRKLALTNEKSQYQKPAAVIPFDICKSIVDILLVDIQKK